MNLRGITESLSDSEMKKVKGGKKEEVPPPITLSEQACIGKLPNQPCTLGPSSGGTTIWGICIFYENIGLRCGNP